MEPTLLTADAFTDWKCQKCGASIDTEEELTQLCGDPFNGTILECPNAKCGAEYTLDMRIIISEL